MDLILEVYVKFLKRTFRPLFEDGFVYSIGSRSVDWGIVSNYRFRPLESTIIPYPLIPSRILLHIESFNCIAANFLLERIRIFKISLSNFSFGRLSRSTFQGGGTSSNFRLEFVFDQ